MMQGFVKKLQELQLEKRRQIAREKATATSATSGAHTSCSQRSTKPTLQVHRPPEMQCQRCSAKIKTTTGRNLVAHLQPRLDHSKVPNTTTSCGSVAYSKPTLDNSEVPDVVLARQTPSSTRDEPEPAGNGPQSQNDYKQGEDKDVMYDNLVKQADNDPTLLNIKQLESLADIICYTAAQSIKYTLPVAMFCHEIALHKASNGAFLEALSKSCYKLFEKREELMGTLKVTTNLSLSWTPYVTFVAKLLVLLESSDGSGASAVGGGEMPSGCWKKAVQSLAILLSSCFHVILRPPSLGSFDEMECLRSAVKATGKTMERVAPHLMHMLMARLRTAYDKPGTTARMRKILLELIQLRDSHWQVKKLSTQIYYNSNIAFQHHK